MFFDQLSFTSELFLLMGVLLLLYFVSVPMLRRNRNLPPGPTGLPIVGYLPFLTRSPHLKLQELGKKYGSVFSLYLGNCYVIVLNDSTSIKEAFKKPEFSNRPPNTSFNIIKDLKGIMDMNGKEWIEHRRYALQSMKDLGLGKSRMEENIKDEIRHFADVIKGYNGGPCNIKELLTPSVSNNICSLVYGRRYDYEDPTRKLLDTILDESTKIIKQTAVYIFFPWAKFSFLQNLFGYKRLFELLDITLKFNREEIQSHKETLNPHIIRDFIDGYLLELTSKKENGPNSTFSESKLIGSVLTLFGAGSETVRTTIDWCLYIMATYSDVQKKVQDEIDDVIGKERIPMWLDQNLMPYTQSVLMEIQRWMTVFPLNLFRYTLSDSTVCGYHIPKDTIILSNLWAAHHDPKHWKDPEGYIPHRFLSEDRKSVVKSDNYIPFSVGKRACPGEAMAVVEVFLYFTSILQSFKIHHPKGTKPDLDGDLGLTYQAKPHKLCFITR